MNKTPFETAVDKTVEQEKLLWKIQNECDPKHCTAIKLLFEVLHEYFIMSNGQKERDIGHKLWAIISSEFIRPEPTEEEIAWAEEELAKRYKRGEDLHTEASARTFEWTEEVVKNLGLPDAGNLRSDSDIGKLINSPEEDEAWEEYNPQPQNN